jgi:hypothetical protein
MINSRRMGYGGHVACMEEKSAYRVLVERRRLLGRCRCRWENNIVARKPVAR